MDGTIIIKVSYQEDIRRFGMKLTDLSLENLQNKIQSIFSIQDEWALKWKDEDGDFVTITQDYELADAKDHQGNKSVLRLWVLQKKSQKKKSPSQQQQQAKAVAGAMVETIHGVISEISSAFKKPPTTNSPTTTTAATTMNPTNTNTNTTTTTNPTVTTNTTNNDNNNNNNNNISKCSQEHSKSTHLARCDVTKKLLWLNGPKWFHKPGTAQDLCEEQWLMLSEEDKATYIEVKSINDLGDEKNIYATSRSRCCPYQKIKRSPYQFGALCDVTDVQLFPGCGWYHLKGSNYDICETIFNQLPLEQQALYMKVEKFDDLDDEYCVVTPNEPKNEKKEELEEEREEDDEDDEKERKIGKEIKEQEQEREEEEQENDEDEQVSLQTTTTTTNIYPRLCNISESSIPFGYLVRVGDKISPSWTIKNTGLGKWNDFKLRACSPNVFKVDHDIAIPSLAPEESATISIELIVPPQTETPRFLFAEFELIDSQEIPFGTHLSIKVNVQPDQLLFSDINQPPVPNEANLLIQLQNAGFTDIRACMIAIRENQGDLNAAALALLRSDQ